MDDKPKNKKVIKMNSIQSKMINKEIDYMIKSIEGINTNDQKNTKLKISKKWSIKTSSISSRSEDPELD